MPNKPWYHEGLRFECTGCGECCTGAPGYVWVTDDEIRALAERGSVSVADFEASFVRDVNGRKSLIELQGGDCVFFDASTRRCHVYPLRPRQCRTFPFWDSCVETPATWEEVCRVCPGAGSGPVIPLEEILRRRKEIRI